MSYRFFCTIAHLQRDEGSRDKMASRSVFALTVLLAGVCVSNAWMVSDVQRTSLSFFQGADSNAHELVAGFAFASNIKSARCSRFEMSLANIAYDRHSCVLFCLLTLSHYRPNETKHAVSAGAHAVLSVPSPGSRTNPEDPRRGPYHGCGGDHHQGR